MIAYFSLYCANALPNRINRTVLNKQGRKAFAQPCACGVTWPIMVGPHDHPSSRGCFHPRPRPRRVISFITADPRSLARIVSERGLHIHNIHEKFTRSIHALVIKILCFDSAPPLPVSQVKTRNVIEGSARSGETAAAINVAVCANPACSECIQVASASYHKAKPF